MGSKSRSARILAAVALAGGVVLLLAPAGGSAGTQPPLRFGPPVQVSPDLASAWEPTLLIDRFGNVFMTARKDTSNQLLLAPDDRSPTATRSMSWVWTSSDGGKTFGNLPAALPLEAANHEWGYEGDLALDDAGHLYFVDQTYADATLTRWTVTGTGASTVDFHRPLVPTGQPVDDRPWLAAHGDGGVFYMAQAGDPNLNPVSSRTGGDAFGKGRYAIYRSTDGANTFEMSGKSLNESGGCRPAADHRPGAKYVYVVCTNDGGAQADITAVPHGRGKLWAYVSADDGVTYSRYQVGDYNADADTFDWPLVTVGPNGDVWAMHVDADKVEGSSDSFTIITNRLHLFHSTDHGRTWSKQDITPTEGRYRWGALVVSPDGEIGIGIHHRPNAMSPWGVYASVFTPGSKPSLVKVDEVDAAASPEPPSEIVGMAFNADETVGFAWTRIESMNGLEWRRVYFARSLPPLKPTVVHPRPRVEGNQRTRPLPSTGVPAPLAQGLVALVAAFALAVWLARPRHSAR
jgi:hypothetical protein